MTPQWRVYNYTIIITFGECVHIPTGWCAVDFHCHFLLIFPIGPPPSLTAAVYQLFHKYHKIIDYNITCCCYWMSADKKIIQKITFEQKMGNGRTKWQSGVFIFQVDGEVYPLCVHIPNGWCGVCTYSKRMVWMVKH